MKPTERQEQAALIEWWGHYAKTRELDERLLFAIPNGAVLAGDAKRRGIQMANLKATGLRAGIPDLFLAAPQFRYDGQYQRGGLFIEMKRKGEKVKYGSAQDECLTILAKNRFQIAVCEGADAAMRAIKEYLE